MTEFDDRSTPDDLKPGLPPEEAPISGTSLTTSTPPSPPAAGLISARGLWAAPPPPPQPLSTVDLGDDATLVILFTDTAARVRRHYLKSATAKGYLTCAGDRCVLCELKKEVRDVTLLPVYLPAAGAVRVLPVSDSVRPGALGPKLRPILERVMDGERLVVEIRRLPDYAFGVTSFPLPAAADDGAATIARFLDDLASGAVRLTDVYPTRTRADLLLVPELAREAALRGVTT